MAMKSALSFSLPFEQRMMTAKMNDCFMAVHPHTIFAPLPLAKVTTLSGVIVAPKPRMLSSELDRYVVLSIAHWKRNPFAEQHYLLVVIVALETEFPDSISHEQHDDENDNVSYRILL